MRFLLLLLVALPLQAQDTVRVKHGNYESVFSVSKRYPVFVEWWVTKAKIVCSNPVKRQDRFVPDPLLRRESDLDKAVRSAHTAFGLDDDQEAVVHGGTGR